MEREEEEWDERKMNREGEKRGGLMHSFITVNLCCRIVNGKKAH